GRYAVQGPADAQHLELIFGLRQEAVHYQIVEIGALFLPTGRFARLLSITHNELGMERLAVPPDLYPAAAKGSGSHHHGGRAGIAIGKRMHFAVTIILEKVHPLDPCHGPGSYPKGVPPSGLQRRFGRPIYEAGAKGSGLKDGRRAKDRMVRVPAVGP